MLRLAVVAEPLAVIAHDHDRDRPFRRSPSNACDQAPQLLVHRRDFAEVGRPRVAAAKGLGRRVGRVRVEVVDPQEQRLPGAPARATPAPGRSSPRAVRSARPAGELVVVDVEPAGEAEAPRQHEPRDEGGRPVAGLLEPLREYRLARGKVPGVLVDAVPRGIEARHHRGCARGGSRARSRRPAGIAGRAPRAR